jgi:hypothetical protein
MQTRLHPGIGAGLSGLKTGNHILEAGIWQESWGGGFVDKMVSRYHIILTETILGAMYISEGLRCWRDIHRPKEEDGARKGESGKIPCIKHRLGLV